jgi:hypothetical protein
MKPVHAPRIRPSPRPGVTFRNMLVCFKREDLLAPHSTQSRRTNFCRLSATPLSMYSQVLYVCIFSVGAGSNCHFTSRILLPHFNAATVFCPVASFQFCEIRIGLLQYGHMCRSGDRPPVCLRIVTPKLLNGL